MNPLQGLLDPFHAARALIVENAERDEVHAGSDSANIRVFAADDPADVGAMKSGSAIVIWIGVVLGEVPAPDHFRPVAKAAAERVMIPRDPGINHGYRLSLALKPIVGVHRLNRLLVVGLGELAPLSLGLQRLSQQIGERLGGKRQAFFAGLKSGGSLKIRANIR